jgi:hypothetical protein
LHHFVLSFLTYLYLNGQLSEDRVDGDLLYFILQHFVLFLLSLYNLALPFSFFG